MTLTQDPRDTALFASLPLVLAPVFGSLPDLEAGRCRLVLARDGLYVEGRTQAFWARGRISVAERLPYGRCEAGWRFQQPVPEELFEQASGLARAAAPKEWAGAVVADADGARLVVPEAQMASEDRVHYDARFVDPLTFAIDLHSHGTDEAFFSDVDDQDDLSNPTPAFMAVVFGRVDSAVPTRVRRIVICGRAFSPADMMVCEHLALRQGRQE